MGEHRRGTDPPVTKTHERHGDGMRPFCKTYWTARGVTPRWQLVGVYLLIGIVGVIGFHQIGGQADRAEDLAKSNRQLTLDVKALALDTRNAREASIRASCERNSASVDLLIMGSNEDQRTGRTPPEEVRRRRDVTLGLLAALRPVDCPRDPRLPVIPPRQPGPSPTPIPSP